MARRELAEETASIDTAGATDMDDRERAEQAEEALRMSEAARVRAEQGLRQVEERLRRMTEAAATVQVSEERYRLLGRATNDVIWDWDLEADRLAWNEAVLEHFGCTREELGPSFEAWCERVHPEDLDRVVAGLRAAIEGDAESWTAEYRFRKSDGSYATFLDRGYIGRDATGKAYRMIGSMLDLTERRRAEEALREADRRKDAFLAMLAHELRNPLAPVRNAIYVLRKIGPREPAVARSLDIIDRQVTHMARLIDDLLDVSRIGRGKIELRKERCDLAQIVRQTAEDYRANLEAGGVTLSVCATDEPLWVDGDRTRLAQIIGNLLHNAGKFTDAGARVSVVIEADPAGGTAVITVEDTGVGLAPALVPHLFDAFSQADQGLDRSKGGLGLGLALVKGLVALHGGTVAAHSEGLGRGARFTVRVPMVAPVIPRAPERFSSSPPAARLRILVVEDNRDAAETLEMALSLAGYAVEVALDGPSGIQAALSARPDVVVCDIGLPGGTDGYAVARALRADAAAAPAFLVALSGYGQDEDRRRSREAGFDAHLVKPANLEELEALMARVARRRPVGLLAQQSGRPR